MVDSASSVVAATCLSMLLSDEPWRDIGFPKRPRVGALFQRFRAAWKPALEKRTIQHMLAAFTATHLIAGKASSDSVGSIIAAYTARPDVLTALGYSTREEGVRHLTETIADYCRTPIGDWASIMVKGIQPSSIPDKALSARLLVGCIQFSHNLGTMVLVLRNAASPKCT
jgi:hypothetical protein